MPSVSIAHTVQPTTSAELETALRDFMRDPAYRQRGAVITDLDGTVVHEHEGSIRIPDTVERGLDALYRLGRPLILNTLRFPLSVIQTVGEAWYLLAKAPIPAVTLNGSQLGYITRGEAGLGFEEIAASPLTAAEIGEILEGVRGLIGGGIDNLLMFYYPRDWRLGEVIWTPDSLRVVQVREKYRSASEVFAADYQVLEARLLEREVLMIVLLINVPEDRLMAYQHSKRSNFFSHAGISKLSGAAQMSARLGVELGASIGAGDTAMDNFLSGVALSLIVGNQDLDFRGLKMTLRLEHATDLGRVLLRIADLQREVQ